MISWTEIVGAAKYDLRVWWNSDPGWQPIEETSFSGRSYTDNEVAAGRPDYYYIVAAVDSNDVIGEWSEQVRVSATEKLPAPTLTPQISGANTVALSWTNVSGAIRYVLYAWDEINLWQQIGGDNLTGTSYLHADVNPGTTFFYTVAAVDTHLQLGAYSEFRSVTVPVSSGPLPAPSLNVRTTVTNTIEISWSEVTGADRYDLWTWWDNDIKWQRIDDSLTGTTYTHTGLTPGTTYYYAIKAISADGAEGQFTDFPYPAATVPESSVTPEPNMERVALVALYEATDGAHWTINNNWLTESPISTWFGVNTNESGHVVELLLTGNGLKGSLPDLSAFTHLERLDLSYNQLNGSIPDLSTLANLKDLYLSDNQLTGSIPDLSALSNLTSLDFGFNQLTGSIPDLSALTQLTSMSLGSNQLSGTLPDLSSLTGLTDLYLTENQLSGSIPDLSDLTSLRELYLGSNLLTGAVPDLGTLTNLRWLDLSHNELTGLPQNMGTLTNLTWLSLSFNQFTGSIPALNSLTNLTWLDLGHNGFTGPIPNLSALSGLTDLSLESNQLTGSIPALHAHTNLTSLSLASNQLSGAIPGLDALTNLTSLSLGSNQLSGSIPALGALTNLSHLDLGSNQLNGQIPVLSSLTELRILTLGSNHLTGPVPDMSALTKLTGLDLSANQICLPASYSFTGLSAAVTAHLQGLSLPTCGNT